MDRLQGLEIFVAVVQHGSFSAAARELGVSKSHTSKQISQLEDRLGARLLNRTTRKLVLTDVGASFYERCRGIMDDIAEAELAVSQMVEEPTGLLRLAVPMSFGQDFVAPALAEFLEKYPDVEVDMHLNDRKVDIVDEGFDLAVRVGNLDDSSLIARKLAPVGMHLAAAPSYLEQRGRPKTLEDLAEHDCMVYSYSNPPDLWRFERDGQPFSVRVRCRLRANNGEALLAAATHGLGIVHLPDWMIHNAVKAGELEVILRDKGSAYSAVWALYPHNRHLSTKVRVLVDFLAERFGLRCPWKLPDP